MRKIICIILVSFCLNPFAEAQHKSIEEQIRTLSTVHTAAEINDQLDVYLAPYTDNAISMPEYQPMLKGVKEIEKYYREIFSRQNIKTFERKIDEIISLDKTIIEIGTFSKEYTTLKSNTINRQTGKYWNVWSIQSDGSLKLKSEAFGYFHPVENSETLVVKINEKKLEVSSSNLPPNVSFELKAYNALMEKGVRERDGVLRSEFFTDDAKVMPFQEPIVSGKDAIKPYLVAYSNRGKVFIDSISVFTYHAEYFNNYVLEYTMFKVQWSTTEFTGRTEGKGIRIWKRQEDESLRIYREIGLHDHLE